jgi:hypothetical protein
MSSTPRGIRNHNPGNLDKGSAKWQGLAPPDQQTDPRFAVFIDPTWGIRAIARTLISYQDKYDIRTIRAIIARWAPPSENNTQAYIDIVCARSGLGADQQLDMHRYEHLKPIVECIIRHENGNGPKSNTNSWYDNATIDAALSRAGVVKSAAVVAAVPVTKETVAATGTASVGVAQLADVAPQVMQAVDSQQDHLNSGSWVRIIMGVATIGLAVYIAWSQVKKHQQGVVA